MSIQSKRSRREEKTRKTRFIAWKSLILFFLLFYNYPFASLLSKDELKSSSQRSHNVLNHSKNEEETRKILIKCSVIEQVTLLHWLGRVEEMKNASTKCDGTLEICQSVTRP